MGTQKARQAWSSGVGPSSSNFCIQRAFEMPPEDSLNISFYLICCNLPPPSRVLLRIEHWARKEKHDTGQGVLKKNPQFRLEMLAFHDFVYL